MPEVAPVPRHLQAQLLLEQQLQQLLPLQAALPGDWPSLANCEDVARIRPDRFFVVSK